MIPSLATTLRRAGLLLGLVLVVTARAAAPAGVTVSEDATFYTLDNGIVTALVAKASGDLVSLKYRGDEILATIMTPDGKPDVTADPPGANNRGGMPFTDHMYGFWSHDAMGPRDTVPATARLTIDPKANGGARAEVSVKGISKGRKMGTGPGSNAQGQFAADIEIRYALGRGESGVYTYCIFDHPADYPAATLGEARFCAKLSDAFDWMGTGAKWSQYYAKMPPRQQRNKYDFTTSQFENPAFGWASTTKKYGFWLLNSSLEYMSGGPTKVEFLAHRDTNAIAAPCVLNYWKSSHYGGASVDVAEGEKWTKVVGPFMLYLNSADTPEAMFADAKAQRAKENKQWPYAWVKSDEYPLSNQRSTVSGQLVLNDRTPGAKMSRVRVGLAHAPYHITTDRAAAGNMPADITWMTDAKHYQFWVEGQDNGRFTIPQVRPGTYTLYAIADGVLGEFQKADVRVEAGKPVNLGRLTWQPVRRGRQLWDVGIPNRNASEFAKASEANQNGMGIIYAKLFPNDVNYVIGQSDFRKDWYFQHVPHATDAMIAAADAPPAPPPPPAANADGAAGRGGRGRGGRGAGGPPQVGRASPWTISFELPNVPSGKATLRVAIAGGGTSGIAVAVNGQPAGTVAIASDSTVGRNGIQGLWYEREIPFAASLLKAGRNTVTLTVPAGGLTAGIVYDYVRLELDESTQAD